MSRPYTPYSTSRTVDHDADRLAGHEYDSDAGYAADYPADEESGYPECEYPADYDEHLDRRWIWVAGAAGIVLMVAVICTGVILGGGDSGSITATTTSTTTSATRSAAPSTTVAPTTATAPPAATAAPAPPVSGAPLSPETVTTVTPAAPAPTASAEQVPAPSVAASAPGVDPTVAARTITYQVTGNRQLIDLVTIVYTNEQGALQTDVNVALPWVKTVTLDPGVSLSSVTATSIAGQLNCAITDANGTALVVQNNNSMLATCTK